VLLIVAFVALPLPQGLRYAAFGLALLNILIACLNVLPVRPLDGHRLLVGLAWWLAGSEAQGKQIARRLGQFWLIVELVSAATAVRVVRPAIGLCVAVLVAGVLVQSRLTGRVSR
jgi:Zn-dependent protease